MTGRCTDMKTRRISLLFLVRESITSIGVTKLRTFLAVIGIVMGVGSVILMVAIGAGSRASVESALSKLGSNIISISSAPPNFQVMRKSGFAKLKPRDAMTIANLPSMQDAAPLAMPQSVKIAQGHDKWDVQMLGTTPGFFPIKDWKFAEGDSFSEADVMSNRRVMVLGKTVAMRAFQGQNGIGRSLRVDNLPFQVVGVLEPKGQSLDGSDMDNLIVVPLGVAKRLSPFSLRGDTIPLVIARAKSQKTMNSALREVTEQLRQQQHLSPKDENNFSVRNLTSIAQTATDTSRTLSLLLGAVASISLVVGGIGIMNIMLVTVTERRREIGIRRSIGATQHEIMLQFLLEAVLIATLGGLGGLLLGVGGAAAAERWVGLPVQINLWSVGVALGIAALVGTASGVYPASRAARINPVEALRTL